MDEKCWPLEHIVGHEEIDAAATVDVVAASIEAKQASVLIKFRQLSAVAPLADLHHVKRIRKEKNAQGVGELSIILSVSNGVNATISKEVQELVDKYGLIAFAAKVSKFPAINKEEWAAQCLLWPTTFHPNCARPEKLEFDANETRQASVFMSKALQQASLAAKCGKLANGAVIVDPSTGLVIASGYDQSTPPSSSSSDQSGDQTWHPLRHAAVVAIESAAQRDRRLFPADEQHQQRSSPPSPSSNDKAEEVPAKRQRIDCCAEDEAPRRPYLCTGFDIYIVREPCAMCAMAMVHQRFRRVIYGLRNAANGALGGKFCLHKQQSLNHHYTVIHAGLTPKDLP